MSTFRVLAIDLDCGCLFLAERTHTLGSDLVIGAMVSMEEISESGGQVSVYIPRLPEYYQDEFWGNRSVSVYEVAFDSDSVYTGHKVFSGVIQGEPNQSGGVATVVMSKPQQLVKVLPDYPPINNTDYPNAPESSIGKIPALIFGEVDNTPLVPIQQQPWTTLSSPAYPGDMQAEVLDQSVFPNSGSVVIDGHTYTYSSKNGSLLLGMSIQSSHTVGTMVSKSGSNVYLASGHALSSITDIKSSGVPLQGASVDLTAGTVSFASPPKVLSGSQRYTLDMHLDAVAAGNTASNAVNAIRAIINTYTQTGTASGVITPTAEGTINFSRPADGNRIISGAYSISFSVSVGAQVGWAHVKIGSDVVWSYLPGTGVVYNFSPASITLDSDVDSIPVTVEVEENGSMDKVSVAITSASRVVSTGNLDEANFATLAPGKVFKATQTTDNPDRGPVRKSRMVVRWFGSDSTLGTTSVKLGGQTIGSLKLTPNSGVSVNKTITVDSVSQGSAALPQIPVSTSVSGGTAAMSHLSQAQSAVLSPSLNVVDTGTGVLLLRGWSQAPVLNGWAYGTDGAISVDLVYTGKTPFTNEGVDYVKATIKDASGNTLLTLSASTSSAGTNIATNTWKVTGSMTGTPASVEFEEFSFNGITSVDNPNRIKISSLSMRWNARITTNAVSLSNTPASGSSSPISSRSLTNSGISVTLGNNTVSLTVPAPPRVVDTIFDLVSYTDWPSFTNKTVEISLSGGGASICLVEVYFQVEYDEVVYKAAEEISATVTGLSGNPSDVIKYLAQASGYDFIDIKSLNRLWGWCDSNSFKFGRVINDQIEALTLLTQAVSQAGCIDMMVDGEYSVVRWVDMAESPTTIDEMDMLEELGVSWAEEVYTSIRLYFKEDQDGDFKGMVLANKTNNPTCRKGYKETLLDNTINYECSFIRDSLSASILLDAKVKRYARPRRIFTFIMPFTYSQLTEGGLVQYNLTTARAIPSISKSDDVVTIRAEEILN